ncbi:MAG: FMN-binding protein [Actinomycetota bacterium]
MNTRQKAVLAMTSAAALAAPVVQASAATKTTPKKKVVTVTKKVNGSQGDAGRWGSVQVTLTIKKTTTTVGKKKTVTRKITNVAVPVYPNHTDRSVFINQQAIPMLVQEELTAQFDINKVDVISGATDTSYAFGQSLQAALTAAKTV